LTSTQTYYKPEYVENSVESKPCDDTKDPEEDKLCEDKEEDREDLDDHLNLETDRIIINGMYAITH
jgi:hypothetical protein